jgi:hypothetical protein
MKKFAPAPLTDTDFAHFLLLNTAYVGTYSNFKRVEEGTSEREIIILPFRRRFNIIALP